METMKASPRPWEVHPTGTAVRTAEHYVEGEPYRPSQPVARMEPTREMSANAALIVRAVNSFDALVEAAQYALSELERLDLDNWGEPRTAAAALRAALRAAGA